MYNLNSPLTCNSTYSDVPRIGTLTSLRDHSPAHHNISLYNDKFSILLYSHGLPCNLVPALFICFISYNNPYVSSTLDFFHFSQMHHSHSRLRISTDAISFACVPLWIHTVPFLQTTLIDPSASRVNDSSSKTVSWIQWLPKQEYRFPLHPHVIYLNGDWIICVIV